jgi:hypothetical protein
MQPKDSTDSNPSPDPSNPQGAPPPLNSETTIYNPFWPVLLVSITLVIVLGWQVNLNLSRNSALRAQNDQKELQNQLDASLQIQSGLEQLVADLLRLAEWDSDAKTLIEKYNISKVQGTNVTTKE